MTNSQDPGGISDLKRDPMHLAVCGARSTNRNHRNSKQSIQNDNIDRLRLLLDVVKVFINSKSSI